MCLRRFRIDRISGDVKVSDEVFAPSASLVDTADGPPWRFGDGEATRVEFLVDALHAPWAVDYLGAEGIVAVSEDGSVTLQEEVRNWMAFQSFLLTFLDGAEILKPKEARTRLSVWLEALL